MSYSAKYLELAAKALELKKELAAMFLPNLFNRKKAAELEAKINSLHDEMDTYFNEVFTGLKIAG